MAQLTITQVGSLPHTSPEDAVSFSLRHDLPFLPELPSLGDTMLGYAEEPGRLSCLAEFRRRTRHLPLVKVQCVGPATLVAAGYTATEAVERCYTHIRGVLAGLGPPALLVLDEPALGRAGFRFEDDLWGPLFGSIDVARRGVHVCGSMDWDRLLGNAEIDVISHDASTVDITRWPGYSRRRTIAWGIDAPGDVRDPQPGDLVTAPCGFGTPRHTVADAETFLRMAQALNRRLGAPTDP